MRSRCVTGLLETGNLKTSENVSIHDVTVVVRANVAVAGYQLSKPQGISCPSYCRSLAGLPFCFSAVSRCRNAEIRIEGNLTYPTDISTMQGV
jgi:hypothetical protein